MTAPQNAPTPPEPKPRRSRWLATFAKWFFGLLAVAAISGGAAYGVFQWQIQGEREQLQQLQADQQQLNEQMELVQQAAEEAELLLTDHGGTTTLDQRLKEIDNLRTELEKAQESYDKKLETLQQSIVDQVAKESEATAEALSLEMEWKSLVTKAQGEVLLTQVHWAEGNRGLARDELDNAVQTLKEAATAAPDPTRSELTDVVNLAEETREALILEKSSSKDSLNLLWHRVNELLSASSENVES